jgi:hypothetical protein
MVSNHPDSDSGGNSANAQIQTNLSNRASYISQKAAD